jgi:undecaprenyl-diphosphatase
MSLFQLFIVSLIQGVTEFLPISSSGHLILLPLLTGWKDQGLAIDMAAHVGTFFAVLIYFRQDIVLLVKETWAVIVYRRMPKLLSLLVVATVPTVLGGFAFNAFMEEGLRAFLVVGVASIFFGILMGLADRYCPQKLNMAAMKPLQALLIGIAQVFALIPGASRSGSTVTMARVLGFKRDEAFRFSFLLSLPVTLGGGLLIFIKASKAGQDVFTSSFFLVAILSGVIGLAAISFMMPLFKRMSLLPFTLYRVALGILLIALSLTGAL